MGNAWFRARFLARSRRCSGQVLGCSWASWSAFGRLLGCLGQLLGVPGPSLSILGSSWAILGSSWTALGRSWAALGRLWIALGRQVGAKMDAKRHKVDPKTLQNRSQDGTKRCSHIRSYSELHSESYAEVFRGHFVGCWRAWGLKNSEKPNGFLIFLYFSWKAILSPNLRPTGGAQAPRWRGVQNPEVQGEDKGEVI